eukprot:m.17134 g.17134  ORF g.17134 m.17134 type:complete len:706 (+) comp3458_c0_seq2:89-2206(+)
MARRGSVALPKTQNPFDHYQIVPDVQAYGDGTEGPAHVVERTGTGDGAGGDDTSATMYTLRLTECRDENEAATVVDEAAATIVPLRHKGVAAVEEFFIHFEADTESWYACSVQPYHEIGALDLVIKQRRTKGEVLPEAIFKKWFGQAVEAIHYMHSKGAVHRNIRPATLFVTDSMDIELDNAAPSIVARDLAMRKRTCTEYLSWQAPEVRPHDKVASQASDIYSLGLVFLELAIATTETPESATTRRQRARDNADGHKDALRTVLVSGCFSKDVVETLTSMLMFDSVQRVSATDLLSDPFVRSCLKLAKSDVLARDEKRAKIAVQVKPTTTKRLPDDTPALLEFLDAQVKRVGVVVGSLEQLGKRALAANEFDLDADARRKVRDAMTKWEGNVYAVTAGINFLRVAYPKLCDEHAAGVRAEFVDTVVTALKTHDLSSMLVQTAAELICALCVGDASCCQDFVAAGAITTLLELWQTNINESDRNEDNVAETDAVISSCLLAVCALAYDPSVSTAVVATGCEPDIMTTLETCAGSSRVVKAVGAFVLLLVNDEASFERLVTMGIVEKLAGALERHMDDGATVTAVAHALHPFLVDSNVAESISLAARVDVVGLVLDALETHHRDAAAAEALVGAVREMVYHDVLVGPLVESEAVEVLSHTQRACEEAGLADVATLCSDTVTTLLHNPDEEEGADHGAGVQPSGTSD